MIHPHDQALMDAIEKEYWARGERDFRAYARAYAHDDGVIWDTAHSWVHGESPADTLRLLEPWLAYLQIKDVRSVADPEPVMLGEGSYPIDGLADALQRARWTGWISLEWERTWHPDLPAIDAALSKSRSWAGNLIEKQGKEQL